MLRLARFAALAFTSALPAWAETRGFDALVVAPDQTVDGLPLATYANLWWQWAFSMAEAESPVLDEVGTFCSVNQAGPVWFLAGGYGSSRIDRVCEVPAGRHLFFPIINVIQVLYPATDADCPALQAEAATNNDRFVYLKVFLDGAALDQPDRYRIASATCFEPFARTPAYAAAPKDALAATDGFWIMLHPLPPGAHRLDFRAFYTNPDEALGEMVQNISYDLTVLD